MLGAPAMTWRKMLFAVSVCAAILSWAVFLFDRSGSTALVGGCFVASGAAAFVTLLWLGKRLTLPETAVSLLNAAAVLTLSLGRLLA